MSYHNKKVLMRHGHCEDKQKTNQSDHPYLKNQKRRKRRRSSLGQLSIAALPEHSFHAKASGLAM
jgi:hypothetical protein